MELTDAERLILSNQYEILAKLDDNEEYAKMAETLRCGYKWLYEEYFDHIWPNLDDDKATLVVDTLDIYGFIKHSYRDLTDRTGIDQSDVEFPGFDGNNEANFRGFAQALLEHRRFEDTLGKQAKNSGFPMVDGYVRMVRTWNEMGRPVYPLSKDQIQELLDAKRNR